MELKKEKTVCQKKQEKKLKVKGELAPPEWRAREGQTDAERRSNTRAIQRLCTHCMMGRVLTHHSVTKQGSE